MYSQGVTNMPKKLSHKDTVVEPLQPYFVQTTVDFDPSAELTVQRVDNPLPHGTLGDIRLAARVEGPAEFPKTILIQPFDSASLRGIDPISVRVFRWNKASRSLQPVWDSGINLGQGFIWAKIRQPGVLVPIGHPRDRLLYGLLRTLARQRRYADLKTPDEMKALTMSHLAPFLETPREELEDVRQQLTVLEVQTGVGPFTQNDLKYGRGHILLAFPLPHDEPLERFQERLRELEPALDGLPEEQLFFSPEVLLEPEPRLTSTQGPLPRPIPLPSLSPISFPPPFVSPDWPMYHHDVFHTGHALGSNINSRTVGRLRPLHDISLDGGQVISIPSIVQGKVYVGTSNKPGGGGTLYKFDLATGAPEGQMNIPAVGSITFWGSGTGGSPAIVDGNVYFTSLDGFVYSVDAATLKQLNWATYLQGTDPFHGQPVDNTSPAAACWTSPLVVNGKVYVGVGLGETRQPPHGAFGFVYCLDASNGFVKWFFCTNKFSDVTNNSPNDIPQSLFHADPAPTDPFTHHAFDPPFRGASVWSSCAYDPDLNQIYVGTGNPQPDGSLPNEPYSSGVLALDADTGEFRSFFQPFPSDSYRANDADVDNPGSPMLFRQNGKLAIAIGNKNGAFFLLDPNAADTPNTGRMAVLARRQLLAYPNDNSAQPYNNTTTPQLPNVDPHTEEEENRAGVYGTAAFGGDRLFVGLGGPPPRAMDYHTTPFVRALNLNDPFLRDAWPTVRGTDGVSRYTASITPRPDGHPTGPMYVTPDEAGVSSPAVVNDVVFVSTNKPGLYALDTETGHCLWTADNLGPPTLNTFILGPAISGDYVVIGAGDMLHIYWLYCPPNAICGGVPTQ
jgi:outer membrane protein assembly factor BamB